MIRCIMVLQVVFFFFIGAFLVEKQIECAKAEAIAATYREMSIKALGEIEV